MVGQILVMIGSFLVSTEIDGLQERKTELSGLETRYEDLAYRLIRHLSDPSKRSSANRVIINEWNKLEAERVKQIQRANKISPWPSKLAAKELDASLRDSRFRLDSLGWRARLRNPIVAFEGSRIVHFFDGEAILVPLFVGASAAFLIPYFTVLKIMLPHVDTFSHRPIPEVPQMLGVVAGLAGVVAGLSFPAYLYPWLTKRIFRIDSETRASGRLAGSREISTIPIDQYDELSSEVLRPLSSAGDRFWEVLRTYGIPGPKNFAGAHTPTPSFESALVESYARGQIVDTLIDQEPFRLRAIEAIARWLEDNRNSASSSLVALTEQGLYQIRAGRMSLSALREQIASHSDAKQSFLNLREFRPLFEMPEALPGNALSALTHDILLSDPESSAALASKISMTQSRNSSRPLEFRTKVEPKSYGTSGVIAGVAEVTIDLGADQVAKVPVCHDCDAGRFDDVTRAQIVLDHAGSIRDAVIGSCKSTLLALGQ